MSDLISRQAALDAIDRLILPQVKGETATEEINRVAWRCAINCAEEMVGHLPSAERRGRWIDVEHAPNGLLYATCSVCGKRQTIEATNYCGNCGADMRETKNGCDDCFIPMFYNLEDDDSICRDCGKAEEE